MKKEFPVEQNDLLGNALHRERHLLREVDRLKGIPKGFYEDCRKYYAGEVGVEVFLK